MKKTDFMIDDIVLVKRMKKEDIVAKVEAIGSSFVMIEEENDQHNPHNFENIEPVALQGSFFEENGFSVRKYSTRNFFELHKDLPNGTGLWDVSICQDGGEPTDFYATIENYENDTDVSICCKYIHQLQHALRLCELDEIADKFKV